MSDTYTDPNGVEITDPTIENLSVRKAWFEGAGLPTKPEGYDDMEDDNPSKIAYDESMATNAEQVANLQALIDAE